MPRTFFSRGRKSPSGFYLFAALAFVLLGALELAEPYAVQASVIFVTNTDDEIGDPFGCSLEEAIYSANLDNNVAVDSINSDGSDHFVTTGCVPGNGDDTIVLPSRGDLVMNDFVQADSHNPYGPTATPLITSNITIEANGATLEHQGTVNFRAFAIGITGSLTLRNAHIKGFTVHGGNGSSGGGGGMGAGGAIFLETGSLTLENCTFEGNRAIGGDGGHYENGAGGGGGGLSGNGGASPNLKIQVLQSGGGGGGSRGNGGTGFHNGPGGGGGTVTDGFSPSVSNSLKDGGFACGGEGGGGDSGDGHRGGANDGHAGTCPGGGGGGGVNTDDITGLGEPGSGGQGNYGGGGGGGGYYSGDGGDGGFGGGGGAGSVGYSIAGNGGNGGFGGGGGGGTGGPILGGPGSGGMFAGHGDSYDGGGGAALGGAVFNDNGVVTIRNSTFTLNFVDHGFSSGGKADPGADAGGAIFSLNGELTVLDSTISGNQSTGSGGGIVLFQTPGSPPVTQPGPASFFMNNTIIANNGLAECSVMGSSITGNGAGNLIQHNDGCIGVTSSDDPQLGPLQDNGGFTPTMAIGKNSPAWNAADASTSLALDQRGQPRPALDGFDIGAFELCVDRFGMPCLILAGNEQTEPLTIQITPISGGTTTPAAGTMNEPLGSVQTIIAKPNPGYSFESWTGDVADPSNATTTVVMDNPQSITATFRLGPPPPTSIVTPRPTQMPTPTLAPTSTPTPVVPPSKGGSISLSHKTIDFGTVGIGVSPPHGAFTITNVGKGELDGAVGTLTPPFTLLSATGNSLLFALTRQNKDTFSIEFKPTAVGPATENLLVISNDAKHQLMTVLIKGIGAGGRLSTPKSFNLPATKVNTKASKTFMLKNSGPGVLSGSVGPLTSPFMVTSSTSFNLGPGQSFPITISFAPSAKGLIKETLAITTNPPTAGTVEVTVQGNGK